MVFADLNLFKMTLELKCVIEQLFPFWFVNVYIQHKLKL